MSTTRAGGGFIEACPDGAFLLDIESGEIVDVNAESARLCGRSREALREHTLGTLTPEEWSPDDPIEVLLDRARDERVTFEWVIEHPEETTVTVDCAMQTQEFDGAKRAVVTVRLASNSTDETGASQELRRLIDGMNDAVMVVDVDGEFVDANQVAVDRLGYTRSELLSMGPADISPPEHSKQVSKRMQRIEQEDHLVFESVQVTADGEEIPVEINASHITYHGEPAILSVARDISRRKERTHWLRTFEQAVEQAGHAVYITDTDGTIEYVNPAFEEITGYDKTTALGKTPAILSAGTQEESYYEELWETVLAGDIWQEEIANERADGERYYADQTIAPIVEDGDVVNFVAVQQDVTERKERTQQLRRYHQLIENVPVGVYRNTPGLAGEFEEVNPAMVDLFGAEDKAELLDTYVAELYRTPGQRERLTRKLEQEGVIQEEKLRLETLDGEPFWAAVTAIRHEVGDRTYYDGIIQDITERREQARELRLREQRFRRLFEGHNAPMLLIDPETGDIERANDAATTFYGYDRETLTEMGIQEINQLDDEAVASRRAAANEKDTNRFIFPHELANGEVRQVEVDSSPIHTGKKRVLFSIIHDVTERERTRDRLEQQNEQLEVLNRVVRHDIRNDMTVILSHAQLLREYVDSEGQEYLDSIAEHGDHAVELTKTVRELMETMLDDSPIESEAIDLSQVLAAELEDAQAGYDADFTVDGTVPNVCVTANEMLSSVFRNLLNNAVQHNNSDEPEVTVSVDTGEESVVVNIADNGPGIPDAQKTDIFGQGEQGIGSSGTGLGLYLVYTFIEQFGGDVWVTDNDPQGAVFHVELPLAE